MNDDRTDRAHDRAVHELARRLRPWAAGMADPTAFARDYVNWLVDDGARWPPGTAPPRASAGDPPNAAWQAARQQFRTEGDTQ